MKKYYFAILAMLCLFFPLGNENASGKEYLKNGPLIPYGSWVYYSQTNFTGEVAFYREKFDGTHKEKLISINEKAWNFQVENGHIYYLKSNGIYRMSLNGQNKKMLNLKVPYPINEVSFEIKGIWLYAYECFKCGWDPDASLAPNSFKVYRTNLETKQTTLLNVNVYEQIEMPHFGQYKLTTENGFYAIDDITYTNREIQFIPTNSLKGQFINFGGKSRKGIIVANSGNLYYSKVHEPSKKLYLYKYNETTHKTTVISEVPKVYGAYLSLDKMYGGYAYFSINFTNKFKSRIYRVPLSGGKLEKVIDISNNCTYSIIGNQLFIVTRYKGIILDRVPLPH